MIYYCCDALRRDRVINETALNGIDYLEVLDHDAPPDSPRQRTLLVRLLRPVPAGFTAPQLRIEGGERVRNINALWVAAASAPPAVATPGERAYFAGLADPDHVLVVRTDSYGDFSPYTLKLVRSALDDTPPQNFDPRLASVGFSFKVECDSNFDCESISSCPEPSSAGPVIDYLAKDYPSLRRLILDRITHLVPNWRERSAADLGVTLAELIAYAGDQLSYQQDAIATEAYLNTARLRTSLRRHALLVDYPMHDGCNARVWLHISANADAVALLKKDTRFYSRMPGVSARITAGSHQDQEALHSKPAVFEALHDATLHKAHNVIHFHTWGDRRCCLPKGATSATLAGHLDALVAGDVLLFEEVLGPATGLSFDANPVHRHVLRLTSVRKFSPDNPALPLTDPLTQDEITEIGWSQEDALPFPLCITAVSDDAHGGVYLDNVSIARGNMVLADHGLTLPADEFLGTVPNAKLSFPPKPDITRCEDAKPVEIPPRFSPALANAPLTFAGTVLKTTLIAAGASHTDRLAFDPTASAASAGVWRMEDTLPAMVALNGASDDSSVESWEPRRDLLSSGAEDHHYVVEVEHDGSARLRFGDGVHGRRPKPGTRFTARYRVGNGAVGNLGVDSIAHIVSNADVLGVRNPLPAGGGVEMEDDATIRRRAPQAFRRQARAVTPEDYSAIAQLHPGVQRAVATLRWSGCWHTVYITVERRSGLPLDAAFEEKLSAHFEPYRMAGHDIEFNDPIYVSLEIDLLVCVRPGYFRADVHNGLLEVLGNRVLSDGRLGFFHPDNLSFGQAVYLGKLYAAARQAAGVASIQATCFQRQGVASGGYLTDGFMPLSRLEIPRLDNDRNFPEHGMLRFSFYGGK